MTDRKYTVAEIGAMRDAIRRGTYHYDIQYVPADRATEVEDMLRTYLTVGTDPDELIAEMNRRADAAKARQLEHLSFQKAMSQAGQ